MQATTRKPEESEELEGNCRDFFNRKEFEGHCGAFFNCKEFVGSFRLVGNLFVSLKGTYEGITTLRL